MKHDRKMAVILVNWRGSDDTIECLASLFAADSTPHVIVVDNASGDGSVEKITAWAEGNCDTTVEHVRHENPEYAKLAKPIAHEVIADNDVDAGLAAPLTIIKSDANLGFAGGNNLGLRAALANLDIALFWVLNNDTIVAPEAPGAWAAAFRENPEWGMAGSPIRLYHRPSHYQMLNGMKFHVLTATGSPISGYRPVTESFHADDIMSRTDFICGASICVTREFLEEVGLMESRFFLYFEEIDWAMRAKKRFAMGYVPKAVIYHKEGASAGSASERSGMHRSPVAEYHMTRSKMIFGRKHYPLLLPVYWLQNMVIIIRRLLRRQPALAKAVWQGTAGRAFTPPPA